MTKIVYVPWGLANRYDETIEINENLKQYPELHDSILQHELQHTDSKGFTKEDFLLDLGPSNVDYFKLFKFMCFYPKSFLQFAPVYKRGKIIFYDINMAIAWSVILAVIGISVFIAVR
jgi:hypothetical protein